MTTPAPLRTDGVAYRIGGQQILGGISVEVRPGEVLGLIGPNGAGKTTLLRSISGLLPADGQVWLEGRELRSLDERAVARIAGRVPQSPGNDESGFTVEEIVLTGRAPYLSRFQWETNDDRAIAHRAMAETDTRDLADRLSSEISGGERQRVFLARALTQEPRLLLLDEPTANLDLAHQIHVLDLVREFARNGTAAVAAIHDLELASRFCDRLLLMKDGRAIAQGSPLEVLTVENLRLAYGVETIVEANPHVVGLRVTVLGPAR